MKLLISLRSEILKTKRTVSFYAALIAAGIIPFIFLCNALSDGLPDEDKNVLDPLNFIFKLSSERTGVAFLPLFIVLLSGLLPQIEYKNHAWKQVFTSPQTKADVFIAKFLNMHRMILFFLVANQVFMWIVVVAMHFIIPELDLLHRPLNFSVVLSDVANCYINILALTVVQFWIGLRARNFIIPVGIGIALWLMGILLVFEYHLGNAKYFPYSLHVVGLSPEEHPQLNNLRLTSLVYAGVFLVLAFLDFRRRRMNT